jgi:hypothetical protein
MSDHGIIWVDIDPSFDPVDYAETFAEDAVVESLLGCETPDEQLLCLYENGYLSKRDGKIQYILPEEALDEASVYSKAMELSAKKAAAKPAAAPGRLSRAASWGRKQAKQARSGWKLGGKQRAMKGQMGPMTRSQAAVAGATGKTTAAKVGRALSKHRGKLGMAALGAGGLLAARALYKKMKARKQSKQESFGEADIEFLLQEAELLGFNIETLEDLDEAINVGAEVDAVLLDAASEGLTEDYSEEDILTHYYDLDEDDDLDEGAREWLKQKTGIADLQKAKSRAGKASEAAKAGQGKMAMRWKAGAARSKSAGLKQMGKVGLGAAGLVGAGLAARALYKRMKRRKAEKQEALDSWDLQHIITDSQELGFEFDSYESLVETLELGELIDYGFGYYLGEDVLAEDITDEVEHDVMDAMIYDLDEEDTLRLEGVRDWLKAKTGIADLQKAKSRAGKASEAAKAGKGKMALRWKAGAARSKKAGLRQMGKVGLGAAGLAALGAGAYALKKRRDRKKQESVEDQHESFRGYRSSAQGSIYESAPVPFGTGNKLYERIRNDLLS